MEEVEILLKERLRKVLHDTRTPITAMIDNPTMQARYGRQINRDASVQFQTLHRFIEKFPNLSAEWLILGTGEMWKKSQPTISQSNIVNGDNFGMMSNVNGLSAEDFLKALTKK